MTKEVRLAIFAIIILAATIWGYTFLVGKDIFKKAYSFNTVLNNVSQLEVSSPVYINGLKVGTVRNITLDPSNIKQMIVEMRVEGEFQIPKNALAEVRSEGMMGGKGVHLLYNKLCSGGDCAQNGDMLKGKTLDLVETMLGNNIDHYVSSLSDEMTEVIDNIGKEGKDGAINETLRELKVVMANMSKLTANTNMLVARSQKNLTQTLNNINSITQNLASNNSQITSMLSNMGTITKELSEAHLGEKMNSTVNKLNTSISGLEATLETSKHTLTTLNSVIKKVDAGDGSLSKLLNDKDLYNNLELTSNNLALLLQDLRLNPRRYLNVSIFKGKDRPYTYPKDDPAYIAPTKKQE